MIFISYAHDDVDFAELLVMKLEKAGIKVWIDRKQLRAGQAWPMEVDEAIRNASAIVAVMTPAARESEYVGYECVFALGARTKVIPIMRKSTQLHPKLESLHYLDFTNRRPWDDLIKLLEDIENHQRTAKLPVEFT